MNVRKGVRLVVNGWLTVSGTVSFDIYCLIPRTAPHTAAVSEKEFRSRKNHTPNQI
jgi:hypothetical protein